MAFLRFMTLICCMKNEGIPGMSPKCHEENHVERAGKTETTITLSVLDVLAIGHIVKTASLANRQNPKKVTEVMHRPLGRPGRLCVAKQ